MGNGTSKEEQLYQAVLNSNHKAVKALRRDGASLEYVDKEGRTPLILACTRGDLFEMALTLLNLGANIKAYRPGTYGGYPLHHAAKRGLDKTVMLLLSRDADPLAVNDDSLTPLHMARSRGHVSVIRMIEDRICIFGGVLRELSGPGFLEAIAPQWMTKKIWAVILPTETDPKRVPKFELVIYQGPKVPLPRTIISLSKAEMEEPNISSPDPVVIILDRNTKSKYKFLAELEGDKDQMKRFYESCKGISQIAPDANRILPPIGKKAVQLQDFHSRASQAAAAQRHAHDAFDDEEPPGSSSLAKISDKLRHCNESADDGSADDLNCGENGDAKCDGWGGLYLLERKRLDSTIHPQFFSSTHEAGTSQHSGPPQQHQRVSGVPSTVSERVSSMALSPSAPPLPAPRYPWQESHRKGEDSEGSQCVVCWNAPAQGACIPCGHLAGCMECLGMINGKAWGCPVCRAAIQQVVRVYAV